MSSAKISFGSMVTITLSINNPAGRLYFYLWSAKNGKPQKGDPILNWREVFELPKDSTAHDVYQRVIWMMKIQDDIVRIVEKCKLNKAMFIDKWRNPMLNAWPIVMTDFREFINRVTPECLQALEFVSARLDEEKVEPNIDEAKLSELEKEIVLLMDEVQASSLDQNMIDFLLRQLEIARRSIVEYRFFGAEPIQEAVRMVVGAIPTDSRSRVFLDDKIGGKVWSIISKLNDVVSLCSGLLAIDKSLVDKFLPK